MFTKETHLCIENNTGDSFRTQVSGTDNFDWEHNSGPHRNFNGRTIGPWSSFTNREEVNRFASNCPFIMTLDFMGKWPNVEFRINQKYAINWAQPNFHFYQGIHKVDYKRNDKTLTITVSYTDEQLQEIEVEALNKDAKAKVQQKKYNEALNKFDQALSKTKNATTRQNLINSKSEAFRLFGLSLMQEGWTLEEGNKAQEAQKKFADAEAKIQNAEALVHSVQNKDALAQITMKIQGDKLFNEASSKESEAFKLFQSYKKSGILTDFNTVQKIYNDSLDLYRKAKEQYENGAKKNAKFGDCVLIVNEQIEQLAKVIDDLNKAELSYNLNHLDVKEEKEEQETNEHLNTNIQEQIDS